MGRAGIALRQTLNTYGIGQSQLASELGIERPIVFRWFHEKTDPTAETVFKLVEALRSIHPDAGQYFIEAYLGERAENLEESLSINAELPLPPSEKVNISALVSLFSKSTTSYKYLFFLSLLDIVRRNKFQVEQGIELSDIFVEMLANAWYPHNYFKLSFGVQDRIARRLDSLNLEISEPIVQFKDVEKTLLRKAIQEQDLKTIFRDLKENVPFRLIVPFLKQELKNENVSLSRGNELSYRMPAIARQFFESRKPLYCFDSETYIDSSKIFLHPDWIDYLKENYAIVRGWVSWEWLLYMQQRNPNIPAIANKLFMPQARTGFSKSSPQRRYWDAVIEATNVRCIYSRKDIGSEKYDIDHFLPWSFVAHDQLWNLVPIIPVVNSSKSNNLPDEEYLDSFIEMQHLGLITSHESMSQKSWSNSVESHVSNLNLEADELLKIEALSNAYKATLKPLISMAINQGFSSGWTYKSN